MGSGREVEGCGTLIKILMFIMNLACLLGGAAVLAIGSWIVADQMYMAPIMGDSLYKAAAGMVITVGCITVILAFLGCWGAVSENKGMLGIYSGLIGLLFIILLIGAILAFAFRGENHLGDNMRQAMNESMLEYNDDSDIQDAWDETQKELNCCGTWMYVDWQLYANIDPPSSCYNDYNKLNLEGCFHVVQRKVDENSKVIGGVGIAIAGILLLGSIMACCLRSQIE